MAYINAIDITNDQLYLIEPTLYIAPSKNGAAYTASLANFSLVTGATVQAKFAATNDANATLNVNSTGAKEIHYNGAKITASQFKVNHVYTLVYDGTQWQVVGDIDTNTNTWRGIQDNLTSDSTTDSLSAKQGKVLKGLIDAMDASTPTASGNATAFIDNITQTDGKITSITKKNIPTVSKDTAGLAPKGAAVSSQSTSTKFLREDGNWATPSYIVDITRSGTTFTVTRNDESTFTFTQQDSDTKSFTITANATDGLWNLTGTNGTNAVTYSLAPYSAKGSAASFYTAATNPTLTTRLNYDGYLYATKLYSDGSEVLTAHRTYTVFTGKPTDNQTPGFGSTFTIQQISQSTTGQVSGTDRTVTIPSLPETATRWPAWGEVTGKPSTFAPSAHEHSYITSRGKVTNETEGNKPAQAGLSMSNAYNNGYPVTYGNVLTMYGQGASQLLIGWSGSSSSSNGVRENSYIRSQRDRAGSLWSAWEKILTSGNTSAPSTVPILAWNTESTIFTLGGTAVKIKAMAKPTYAFADLTAHPTTLSDYGITDAKIASDVITLGSNTITPITSIADLTGSTITATNLRTNLGLSAALRFIGKATTDISESTTTAPTVTGVTNYAPEVGDVVLDKNSDSEYVCIAKTTANNTTTYTWELLGRSGSWATSTHTHGNITNGGLLGAASMAVVTDGSKKITTADLSVNDSNASTNATTTFVQAVTQNAQGKITVTKASLNTSGTWSGKANTAGTADKATNDADGHDIRKKYVAVYNTNDFSGTSTATFTDLAAAGNAMGMIYAATDNPEGKATWVHGISLAWKKGTTSSWISQIALGVNSGTGMWYRTTSGNIVGEIWTRILDDSNYSKYALPLSGGTMDGAITFKSQSSAFNNSNIIFSSGGIIGGSTSGNIGIYASTIYLRGSSNNTTNSSQGILITGTQVDPYGDNAVSLGTSTLRYKNIHSVTFTGNLTGNASTATSAGKWTTARTLTIGNKSQSVDGSDNVSWTLADIGAAPSSTVSCTTANVESALGIDFITHAGALNTNGWKTLGARTNGAKIAIAYNNNPASWNSATYSASLVFGCADTKGLLDCGHDKPIVTFGGSSNANSTDAAPKWYFKLSGTSGQTYTFPSTSKTLAATDGSNASGKWSISTSGKADTAGTADKATAANLATTTNALAYYTNETGTFGNTGTYIKYLNHVAANAGTNKAGYIDGLHITGAAYGEAANLISNVAGKMSYGDAGPQIRFTCSGQNGAIIFNHYDNTTPSSTFDASFNFVTDQGNGVALKSNGFIINGTTTWLYNNNLTFSHGGGWYMNDATWIRTFGDKSIYQNTGTMRTDGIFQVGQSGKYVLFSSTEIKLGDTTAASNGAQLTTINGHVVINAAKNTDNAWNEGLRINNGSNNWSTLTLGGDDETTKNSSKATWSLHAYRNDTTNKISQFYLSYNGSSSAATRITGHANTSGGTGFSIRPHLGIAADPDTNYALKVSGDSSFIGDGSFSGSLATKSLTVDNAVTLQYNSTDKSLDFVFA